MNLKFVEKDFEKMQRLEAAFRRQLGSEVYASTTYASLVLNYSPKLTSMLRPYPPQKDIEVELSLVNCCAQKHSPDCEKVRIFLKESGEVVEWESEACRSAKLKKALK